MFLVDTNIFLEILLSQNRKDDCKRFIEDNVGSFYITLFSFHSIGVILFRTQKEAIFLKFLEDILPDTEVINLPIEEYQEVISARQNLNLDFDDAYQYCVAKHYDFQVVTMDGDFNNVPDIDVLLL